ncbi:hypothetical protein [Bradyrhizobium sp. TM233]|uniref:hypothetical protein n=1 Tax=Bradyrhizobium sp. TM233 TaxID=2599801 RepID=UPI0030C760F7
MIHRFLISIIIALFSTDAFAQFHTDEILKSKEPLTTAVYLWSNKRCVLTSGTAPQLIGKERRPSPMNAGTIFVPKRAEAGSLVDIDLKKPYCRTRKLLADEIGPSDIADHKAISFAVGAELKVNLKVGEFLNLVDVDLADIDEVGVRVDSVITTLPDVTDAAIDVLRANPSCKADSPGVINDAVIIVENCVGTLRASLKSKKNLTIKALDLKFAQLFGGLSAGGSVSWKREIQGGIKTCSAAKKDEAKKDEPKKDEAKKDEAKKDDKGKGGSAEKAPNTDSTVSFEVGGSKIDVAIVGNNEVKVLIDGKWVLSGSQVKKNSAKEQSPTVSDSAAKNTENVDIEKDCSDTTVYVTSDLVLFGLNWIPAKPSLEEARQFLKASK